MDIDEILALAGRVLLASLFLAAAFGKVTNFSGTVQYMEAHGLPWPSGLCVGAVLIEALGSMALILGVQTRIAAALLGGFLLVVTAVFHASPDQRVHLLKNLAVLGGLLHVIAFGPGGLSLEGRRLTPRKPPEAQP